jgi:tungstate transport system permease protein
MVILAASMQVFTDAFQGAFSTLASGEIDVLEIVRLSLVVSGAGTFIAIFFGVPAGFWLGTTRSVGRHVALVTANAGMGLPPVVVGLVVSMLLSRRGPLGDLDLLYTKQAMVMAQVVIATPVIAAVTASAVSSVPRELRLQVRSLGATKLNEAWMMFREARVGLIAAVAAGFGSVISEVGAVQMVGGNINGETRVMTTAIVSYTRRGRYGEALALAVVLLTIVVIVNIILTSMQTSAERWERDGS